MELILASGSPRRRELLELAGYDFSVEVSRADEDIPICEPGSFVESLALAKAAEVASRNPDAAVVGCDTIVYLDGEIIGKPADKADAARLLRRLSGRTHTVYTGAAIIVHGRSGVFHDETRVTFRKLSEDEILAYVKTGDPMDKAGAYGIQGPGAILVAGVEGCYFTVMGLPTPKLYEALRSEGIFPRWM